MPNVPDILIYAPFQEDVSEFLEIVLSAEFSVKKTRDFKPLTSFVERDSGKIAILDTTSKSFDSGSLNRMGLRGRSTQCIAVVDTVDPLMYSKLVSIGIRYILSRPIPIVVLMEICSKILNKKDEIADSIFIFRNEFVRAIAPRNSIMGSKMLRAMDLLYLSLRDDNKLICVRCKNATIPTILISVLARVPLDCVKKFANSEALADEQENRILVIDDFESLLPLDGLNLSQRFGSYRKILFCIESTTLDNLLEREELSASDYFQACKNFVQLPSPDELNELLEPLAVWWIRAHSTSISVPESGFDEDALHWIVNSWDMSDWSQFFEVLSNATLKKREISAALLKRLNIEFSFNDLFDAVGSFEDYIKRRLSEFRYAYTILKEME